MSKKEKQVPKNRAVLIRIDRPNDISDVNPSPYVHVSWDAIKERSRWTVRYAREKGRTIFLLERPGELASHEEEKFSVPGRLSITQARYFIATYLIAYTHGQTDGIESHKAELRTAFLSLTGIELPKNDDQG